MFALFLIATIFISTSCDAAERKYTALQFGTTANDYIRFSYDMSPFRNSFTLTAWIKRVYTSSSHPVVFHYWASRTHEILIAAAGHYNRAQGNGVLDGIKYKFTTPPGTWFHYALSWSSSTQTIDVYLDGERVATGQTSSWRELQMGGELWINRLGNSASSRFVFGGQLYQLNFYSGVLTAEYIKEIADGGLCLLDFRIRSPALRWEDILAKSRIGSVTEVTACDLKEAIKILEGKLKTMRVQINTVTEQLNNTQNKLESVTAQLNRTEDNLGRTKADLRAQSARCNKTEDDLSRTKVEMRAQSARCNQTEDDLGKTKADLSAQSARCNQTEYELSKAKVEMKAQSARLNQTEDDFGGTKADLRAQSARLNQTEGLLATCSSALTDTRSQLDGARKLDNITQWDVLYREPYYNNVVSEELINHMKSSWNLIGKYIGLRITDTTIEHFRRHETDFWDM